MFQKLITLNKKLYMHRRNNKFIIKKSKYFTIKLLPKLIISFILKHKYKSKNKYNNSFIE